MKTPFGVFYSTNITPDPETGIGRWSDSEFVRAMREGLAPDGHAYFPVFPYPSFTGMGDEDVLAMKAYLFSLAPVRRENRPHDAWPPFSWRIAASAWRWMFFEPQRFAPDPARTPEWNRGAYLVTAVAHCGECHTPRTLPGALDRSRWLARFEGRTRRSTRPEPDTGGRHRNRSCDEDRHRLVSPDRATPDGDATEGLMKEVIEHGYGHLPESDLQAIAAYLHSLPPVRNDALAEHEHGHEHGDESASSRQLRATGGMRSAREFHPHHESASRRDEHRAEPDSVQTRSKRASVSTCSVFGNSDHASSAASRTRPPAGELLGIAAERRHVATHVDQQRRRLGGEPRRQRRVEAARGGSTITTCAPSRARALPPRSPRRRRRAAARARAAPRCPSRGHARRRARSRRTPRAPRGARVEPDRAAAGVVLGTRAPSGTWAWTRATSASASSR